MKLKELGALLQEERLRQGLSLDDIKDRTKVSEYVLRGIENGEASKLPVEVYARSFVKAYIKALDLDSEEMRRNLEELFPEDNSEFSSVAYRSVMTPLPSARQSMNSVFLVFLIFLLLGVGLWFGFSFMKEKWRLMGQEEQTVQQQEESVAGADGLVPQEESVTGADGLVPQEEIVQETSSPAGENNTLNSEGPAQDLAVSSESKNKEQENQSVSPPDSTPQASEVLSEDTKSSAELPTDQTEVQQQDLSEPRAEAVAGEKNVFELKSVGGECWLRAEVDGKVVEKYLYSGQGLSFSYAKKLRLRLGNATVLQATLNGEPYVFTGKNAVQVVELVVE